MSAPRLWLPLALLLLAPQTPAQTPGDAAQGREKSATCVACHGVDGNSINPEWPSLAGQGELYLASQLRRFRSGERSNVLMDPQAAALSDRDIADLAAYYAAQKPKPGVSTADEDLLALGERIYRGGIVERRIPACMACHGPTGAGNAPAQYPRLAGQHAQYIVLQLKSYREQFEAHKRHTRTNPMMNSIAAGLTDREIEAVAHYVPGLY